MKNITELLSRIGTALVAMVIVLFVGDYVVLKIRGSPLGSVPITKFYAVPQKSGKTNYEPGDQATETCVSAILPHMGYEPCWYVRRHRSQQVNL